MTIANVGSQNPVIVNQLLASGDPGAEMAALAVENGTTQRKVASETREAYEAEEASEDQKEVDAMRQKANDIETEGWVQAAGMAAQGAMDVTGGVVGLKMLGTDSSQLGIAKANDVSGIFRGLGLGASAASAVGASGARAAEANDDANAALHKANADQAKEAAEDMHDAQQGAADYVKAGLDFYRDYVSTDAQTHAAALHKV
ncbi:MAG TPA: hypothetical protein VMI75_04910 [Polyangiaceae bacterium]|nr:hypothetical protein [Polyangiaceae bacterium]